MERLERWALGGYAGWGRPCPLPGAANRLGAPLFTSCTVQARTLSLSTRWDSDTHSVRGLSTLGFSRYNSLPFLFLACANFGTCKVDVYNTFCGPARGSSSRLSLWFCSLGCACDQQAPGEPPCHVMGVSQWVHSVAHLLHARYRQGPCPPGAHGVANTNINY